MSTFFSELKRPNAGRQGRSHCGILGLVICNKTGFLEIVSDDFPGFHWIPQLSSPDGESHLRLEGLRFSF
jgi:hypothetical protein